MSQLATTKTREKKRKHVATESSLGEPSTKRSKTGLKGAENVEEKIKEKKKSKGKPKADDGQFKVINATLAMSIPPVFANNLQAGVEEMLDSMIMRYVPAVQGVVLAHDNLTFLESTARIKADCPFTNCHVSFDATVWSPSIGMKLVGRVNLCSPDHISLLLHRTFNVSIPRHHIPTDNWEFEYGPAENDPVFGAGVAEEPETVGASTSTANPDASEGSGKWVHKVTGTNLGGAEGYLEFTVIGLTIANQMLSLVGSLQEDPFSSEHVPERPVTTASQPSQDATESSGHSWEDEQVQLLLDESSDDEQPVPAHSIEPIKVGRNMSDKAVGEKKRKREKSRVVGQQDKGHQKKRKKE